jgi:Xaa-Pro aminopeptidase/Xaa-Pro dipeptidase
MSEPLRQEGGAPFPERAARIRARLSQWSAEGVVFFGMPGIRYLTGFTGSEGTLFVGSGVSVLIVDGRYTTQAREEAPGVEVVEYRDRMEGLCRLLGERGLETVAFDAAALSCEAYFNLRNRLGDKVVLRPMGKEIAGIRKIKEPREVDRIRRAAAIASDALLSVLCDLKPGRAEIDIARRLEREMENRGSERPSFETIVVSGKRAALPHGRPGKAGIGHGDVVVLDFGAVVEGYCSDETCTVAVGRIPPEKKKVYEAVKEAHDRAIERVREGVSCREVDETARGWIEKAGLGPFFTHGTGHGVGLEVHEVPRISAVDDGVLEEGMVVTVEPGVYIPGEFGVRIEDLLLVKKDGCEILSSVPKDLMIVE